MNGVRQAPGPASLAGMALSDDELGAKLPREVLSDLGGWTLYQSFRVFTWPWLLRRIALFGALAILAGFAFAAWHASGLNAWGDWPGLAWRACLASLAAVSVGPLLATFIRHLRLPLIAERALVVVAIVAGLAITVLALRWTGAYHRSLMLSYAGRSMDAGLFGRAMSRFFLLSIDASTFALIIAGGGLAAFHYLGERRRIAQYRARLQVERLRAERDTANTRLAVLQAQVEPHFLFNTLASVRSLIATEPKRAAGTVDALSAYLRATLPRLRGARVEETSLGEQIALCTGYLDLIRVRMADRLEVRVEASETVRALPFPPLILLTLVENAVTHGIEPKVGPGTIAIIASVEQDMLTVSVEDDGGGLAPGVSSGLGLTNVRAQLLSLFGERAALEVVSRPEGGARASIRIPLPLS
jgi:signal transduction histidine kinase